MLFEFAFSGDIAKGYWLKHMAIKKWKIFSTTFSIKNQRQGDNIWKLFNP